jgi:hypothetical protein
MGVVELAHGCSQLQTIDLSGCQRISNVSVVALTHGCRRLNMINIVHCAHVKKFNSCDTVTLAAGYVHVPFMAVYKSQSAAVVDNHVACSPLLPQLYSRLSAVAWAEDSPRR